MNKQKLPACLCIAGALAMLAAQTYAQTEPPTPLAQAESSAQADLPSNTEPPAKSGSSISTFIANLDIATRAIFEHSKKDPALIREGCRDLLNEVLDLDAMAHAAIVEIWAKMTTAQRDTFRVAFEQRMIGNCVRQFGGYEGETLQLAGVRTSEGGHLLATIRIGPQDDAKLVTWRLHNSGPDRLRAIDVITEGRSAVLDAGNEFAAVLQSVNGDIEALIAFVRK